MNDLRDLSRLPRSRAYWEQLEARVRSGGKEGMGSRARRADWMALFARNAAVLGGLALAAGITALLLVPPRIQGETTNPTVLFRLPEDPAMAAFLASPSPPPLAALMAALPRSAP